MPGPAFLQGDNISLRTVETEDLQFLQEARNDARIRIPTGRPDPLNGEQAREFYEETICGDDGTWLLVADGDDQVGVVAVKSIEQRSGWGEVGYWIHPDDHQQGYGCEAVSLLVAHAFDQLGLHRLEARTFEHNTPSRRLAESVGFTQEGVEREKAFVDGQRRDVIVYGLLAPEWASTER